MWITSGVPSVRRGSLPNVFVEKGKHVGVPNVHAEMEEVVPIDRVADGRIDLQAMQLTEVITASAQKNASARGLALRWISLRSANPVEIRSRTTGTSSYRPGLVR